MNFCHLKVFVDNALAKFKVFWEIMAKMSTYTILIVDGFVAVIQFVMQWPQYFNGSQFNASVTNGCMLFLQFFPVIILFVDLCKLGCCFKYYQTRLVYSSFALVD